MPLKDEEYEWLKMVLKVNVRHVDVKTSDNPLGFLEKARGDHFEGEHEQAAWRFGDSTKNRKIANANKDKRLVTRAYSEKERLAHTMTTNEDGYLQDQNEDKSNRKARDYVVDPKTGEVITTDGGLYKREMDPNSLQAGKVKKVRGSKLKSKLDEIYSNPSSDTPRERLEVEHHSTPLAGANVASAGEITVEKGKVKNINNNSGHYQPRLEHLLQVVEHLTRQGATLNTEIVDAQNNSRELSDNPAAFALFDKLQPKLKQLKVWRGEIIKLSAGLTEEISEAAATEITGKIKTFTKQIEPVEKAIQVIAKLGIGKSNKFLEDSEVGIIQPLPGMTGAQIKQLKPTKVGVEDFLKGGADSAAKANKEAMLSELELLATSEKNLRPEDRPGGDKMIHETLEGQNRDSPPTKEEIDQLMAELSLSDPSPDYVKPEISVVHSSLPSSSGHTYTVPSNTAPHLPPSSGASDTPSAASSIPPPMPSGSASGVSLPSLSSPPTLPSAGASVSPPTAPSWPEPAQIIEETPESLRREIENEFSKAKQKASKMVKFTEFEIDARVLGLDTGDISVDKKIASIFQRNTKMVKNSLVSLNKYQKAMQATTDDKLTKEMVAKYQSGIDKVLIALEKNHKSLADALVRLGKR